MKDVIAAGSVRRRAAGDQGKHLEGHVGENATGRSRAAAPAHPRSLRCRPTASAGGTRADRFGRGPDTAWRVAEEVCFPVRLESVEALGGSEAIAAVEGADGISIGHADLAASVGDPGRPGHPEVATRKPAGLLALDPSSARRCIERGTLFTAAGTDGGILSRDADALRTAFPGVAA